MSKTEKEEHRKAHHTKKIKERQEKELAALDKEKEPILEAEKEAATGVSGSEEHVAYLQGRLRQPSRAVHCQHQEPTERGAGEDLPGEAARGRELEVARAGSTQARLFPQGDVCAIPLQEFAD